MKCNLFCQQCMEFFLLGILNYMKQKKLQMNLIFCIHLVQQYKNENIFLSLALATEDKIDSHKSCFIFLTD